MRVEGYNSNYYIRENTKQIAVNAASSAILSTGLTLAFNKGQNPKNAAKVGLIVAGISVAIDLAKAIINRTKAMKTDNKTMEYKKEVASKLGTHQG